MPAPSSIPSFDLGSPGTPLHFLHANGYPPACYQPLLELFQTQYHVFGMLLRPLWKDSNPKEIHDWMPFSADLLRFLSSNSPEPVIGVGHSIGAVVTLRAALREPHRFRALVRCHHDRRQRRGPGRQRQSRRRGHRRHRLLFPGPLPWCPSGSPGSANATPWTI